MIRALRPLALLLLVAAPGQAAGLGHRPFHGRVAATWDNVFLALGGTAAFQGGGPVTHMGRTTQAGTLALEFGGDPTAITGTGTVTITAADGSSVTFEFVGLLDATTGLGTGAFEFTAATGRFAAVSGAGTFQALIDLSAPAGQAMAVILDGAIDY